MKFNKLAIAVTTLLVSGAAWSHGYLMDPPARAYLCTPAKQSLNTGCGAIQTEPQSLEAPKGFPYAGPLDGMIASANTVRGPEMDAQSETRWHKTPMSAGQHQFTWFFTAPHVTDKYEYFITKNDWNPNKALSRASFESTPFCTVSRGGVRPGQTDSHSCNVPAREGYQVILAVWTVGDTSAAFYNTADVDFGGHNAGGGDDGAQEEQHIPVINFAQSKIVVEKNTANAGYAIDATKTQYATNYVWEVIDGYSNFQLQEKNGAQTYHRLEGPTLNMPRAWVGANHTGTGTYRLTASNDFGSVTKDIQVEVKDSIPPGEDIPGGDIPGNETPAGTAWKVGVAYKVGDVVTYENHSWRCQIAHRSQTDWLPGGNHPLWVKVK